MRRDLHFAAIWALVMALLTLTACDGIPVAPSTQGDGLLLPNSLQTGEPCVECAQATLAAALTQDKNNTDNQAAATAEIVRANAQATLNSANATLNAAQTQEQNNANVVAAQIAATAEMERANALATLNSAGATQSAALTQDAIYQTQMAAMATTGAEALAVQQSKDELAASTQTAVANNIATQTQAAVATSQWYADQERQREEQWQGPIAFLWMWCFPVFFVLLFAGLVLWGFWRWQKNRQANQIFLENPVDRLPAPMVEIIPHQHDDSLPYLESDVDDRFQHVKPDDQVRRWLDEVKRKLLNSDKEDEENETDN